VPVGDDVTTAVARQLISEYLSWVAGVAGERHGLTFGIDILHSSSGWVEVPPYGDNSMRDCQADAARDADVAGAVPTALRP
jgi:hypothetical protein